jgi:hypothetical protein
MKGAAARMYEAERAHGTNGKRKFERGKRVQ